MDRLSLSLDLAWREPVELLLGQLRLQELVRLQGLLQLAGLLALRGPLGLLELRGPQGRLGQQALLELEEARLEVLQGELEQAAPVEELWEQLEQEVLLQGEL